MPRLLPLILAIAVLTVSVAACNRPLLGFATDVYVRNDGRGMLELSFKETMKGFVRGQMPNPHGWFTLMDDQRITGEFTHAGDSYVLKSEDSREIKLTQQSDSTLRDESGNVWKLQTHDRSFQLRPIEKQTLKKIGD